mgnify:FL=1
MDKFNSEGYADLTAYEALMKIEQEERAARKAANFRPLVYICSPYSGNTEFNANNARIYSRFAVAKGAIPLAPHLLFPQFMSEEHERSLALFMGSVLLGKCKEVWVFGDTMSEGMKIEIAKAKKMGKMIRYFNEELEEIQCS